jgi:hypothetical protein
MARTRKAAAPQRKVYIAGEPEDVAPRSFCNGALRLEVEQAYAAGAARGAASAAVERQVAENRLVEIELEGGIVLYTAFDQLQRDFPADAAARSAVGAGDDAYVIPLALPLGGEARGVSDWAVRAWRFLAVRFDEEHAAKLAARGLSWLVEHRIDARVGLHSLALDDDLALDTLTRAAAPAEPAIDVERPVLLFIHGTGSSSAGSFEGLWAPQNRALRAELAAQYGANVLACEHLTLSVGPIRNALDIASALPAGTRLHLVTHSRGGLVGELLARGNRNGLPAFDETDFSLAGEADATLLKSLGEILAAKGLRVERFVRVACPARGTSLASGRLDRYLSVIINLLRFASLGGSVPVLAQAEDLTAFVAAVIERRSDASQFPGLEAMMPESRLVRLLNRPGVHVAGDLTVIAGDAEPQGLLKRLALLVTDLFYDGDHDFVVDTENMRGGAARDEHAARIFRHSHGEVSHFRYFVNGETSRRVVAGLLQNEGFADAFAPIARSAQPSGARGKAREPGGPAPVVFLLPGIMGSALGVAAGKEIDTVWMSVLDLAAGGLCRKLPIPDKFRVVAEEPLTRTYGRLIEFLGETHRVVPFAYDWRKSLREEAGRLAERLGAELDRSERENQPLRILAHSMGGLLTRALLAFHPEVWGRACRHPGVRVIMLGTPTRGSHSITQVLAGRERMVGMLAALDLRNSKQEILATIARYPGVLELLPDARGLDQAPGKDSLLDAAFWQSMDEAQRGTFAQPAQADLDAASAVRRQIADTRFEPGRLIYVAGKADETPVDFTFDDGEAEFLGTGEGDGRVPWKTGIPDDRSALYYLDAVHGDMADTPEAFPALLDLLAGGATARLSQQPPTGARGEARVRRMKAPSLAAYPDEELLERAAAGGTRRARVRAGLPRVQISLRHGDLRYARHPLAVGHYFGDSILSAEGVLDRLLDRRLSAMNQLGLYPGMRNTAEVFVNADPHRPSAIVIGLGGVGELGIGSLAENFATGLLRYAALVAEGAFGEAARNAGVCGVSALLIGTGAGGLPIGDSLTGLLRGMRRAAETLRESTYEKRIRFDELELIELYEDRAIAAVHALQDLAGQVEFSDAFVAPDQVLAGTGGRRRARFEEAPNWWQRLQVTRSDEGGLRFISLTQRARAEARLQALQRPLVDRYLKQARDGTAAADDVGVTLFELLLPNEIKAFAPEQDNLVLILDEDSARYPWELLRDRRARGDEPMVVQRGVLRQLQTAEYRARPDVCRNTRALVVGDPLSGFAELPGAQREAELVATQLEAGANGQRFRVTRAIRENARNIVRDLMADDYRILHLAGHGVFEYPVDEDLADPQCEGGKRKPRYISGMVIGDGVFLTPAEVSQMRAVPDLVFINCCHLGRTDAGSARNEWFAPHRLAANLAVEFIRMGVRAVIAAGWEVDDQAANCFAEAFYREMLAGTRFGRAVQRARRETWERHRHVNTWGAYQCYGDPDYGFTPGVRDDANDKPAPYVAAAEALCDLDNIAAEAASCDPGDRDRFVRRIADIEKRLPEFLTADDSIRLCMGRSYYDCRDFAAAVRCYESADPAALTPRDMEQFANAAVRHAEQIEEAGGAGKSARKREAEKLVDGAIARLEGLLRFQPGVERYNMMGAAQKRRAMLVDGAKRRVALARAAFAYASAARLAEAQTRRADDYGSINAWAMLHALAWHGGKPVPEQPKLPARDQALPEIEVRAENLSHSEQFWERALAGDCALLRLIGNGKPGHAEIDKVSRAYRAAAAIGARPREWNSVLSQIALLARLAESAGQDGIASALGRLRAELGH